MQPGLVLDADALYMLSLDDYRDIFEQLLSYENDVITPNSLKSKRTKEALHSIRNNEDFLDDKKWFNGGILVQTESGDVDVKIYYIEVERIGRYQYTRGSMEDVLAGSRSAYVARNRNTQNSALRNDYATHNLRTECLRCSCMRYCEKGNTQSVRFAKDSYVCAAYFGRDRQGSEGCICSFSCHDIL
jgi:NAD(P)H-hydrate repair Nnr-like enzyme with NAD(P)H-hydrate dehydratase domain